MLNKSVIYSWLGHLVQTGSGLIILPLLLKYTSSAEIAIWLLFQTIAGLAAIVEVGISVTLTRVVGFFFAGRESLERPEARSGGTMEPGKDVKVNKEGLATVYAASRKLYKWICGIGLAVFFASAILLINPIKTAQLRDAWLAYGIFATSLVVLLHLGRYNSFLLGTKNFTASKRIEIATGLARLFGFVVIILFGGSLISLAITQFVSTLLLWFLLRRKVRAVAPAVYLLQPDLVAIEKIMPEILPNSYRQVGMAVGAYLIHNGVVLIASQSSDLKFLASLLFTLRVLLLIRGFAQAPVYARIPEIIGLMANFKIVEVRRIVSTTVLLCLGMALMGLIGLAFAGDFALSMLGTDKQFIGGLPYVSMCLWMLLEMHHSIHAQVYMTSNHVPFLIPALLSGAFILIGGYLLLPIVGIEGLIFWQLLVQLSFNNWFPVYLNLKLLHWPFKMYLSDIISIPSARIYNKQ